MEAVRVKGAGLQGKDRVLVVDLGFSCNAEPATSALSRQREEIWSASIGTPRAKQTWQV